MGKPIFFRFFMEMYEEFLHFLCLPSVLFENLLPAFLNNW